MRLLIVEDEPDLLAAVAQSLAEDGHAVDTAADGLDGLAKAAAVPYDAVVLDLMLPKLDGWQLLRRLRAGGCRTPVLVLTARGTVADRVRGLDGGADDYLPKPFDLDELAARLRALVRRSAGVPRSVIDVGDVRLDLTGRTATRGGVVVPLTSREYAIVEYLALHAGDVVTRAALYEHVFDEQDDSLSNLLEVHVFNVRRKLGKAFITTRRGHGYLVGAADAAATGPGGPDSAAADDARL